jgi:Protein-disulfide isomerase
MKNALSKNTALLIALIVTLIAVGVHIYSTQHFYQLRLGGGDGAKAVCNINEVMNCDAVAASKYATFLGVPVALWGAVTNGILLYLLLVTRFNMTADRERTSRYTFMLSAITIIATLVMATISFTSLGKVCLFCAIAYVLSIIGFIFIWLGAEELSFENLKEDFISIFSTERWILGFAIAIPALAFVINLMYNESHGFSGIDKMAKQQVAYWAANPEQKFDMATGLTMQNGNATPVMTIVEFADFRCPHCKVAAPSLHAFTQAHPDVKLLFKPFPLDGTCNEAMQNGGDGISCGLAASVMCSEKLAQKGWIAHDYIFENQQEITMAMSLDKNLEDVAKKVDVKLEDLKACVNAPETSALIRTMAKEGATAQIRGTPAVFVNGRMLDKGQAIPILEAVYKSLK